jgi:hypothetical protein
MAMGHRGKLKTGDEWDAFSSKCRRFLTYLQRAGTTHKIKKSYSRRLRRLSKGAIREDNG